MSNLYANEDTVFIDGKHNDEDAKRYRTPEGGVYETYCATTGDLYRACVKTHGRCIGKMYVGEGVQAGWIFLKRNPEGKGCIETWVEVYVSPPVKSVQWSDPVFPTFSNKKGSVR